jgi:hypothetical protein
MNKFKQVEDPKIMLDAGGISFLVICGLSPFLSCACYAYKMWRTKKNNESLVRIHVQEEVQFEVWVDPEDRVD